MLLHAGDLKKKMERIENVKKLDIQAQKRAQERWNSIAKPLHSLGQLEEIVVKIAGITGNENISLDKRCVVVMCSDNGVVCEGVTQSESNVTGIVAKAIADGSSNVNKMAEVCHADVIAVDIGINGYVASKNVIDRKIANGTKNIAVGAAMTIEYAEKALSVGIDIVKRLKEDGFKIIVTGEMGIGNTTTSSALASVILGLSPEKVTGRGAGLDSRKLEKKKLVIEKALKVNAPSADKPVELLAKLGGFDIAGIAGLFLGGAIYKIPVIIDGFISAVSAAVACLICPESKNYMLCSHVSNEPAGEKLLDYLGMKPLITAGMHLGEGTGGVLLLPMLDAAQAVYNSAHRFDELSIERYKEF